ncbi:hypothetical protein LPJ72_004064 [Coemansia sp. Benny D160-2]|nr:hypothetical protein LPJ72_004064 [Coemansia sp. Benny D160-2]
MDSAQQPDNSTGIRVCFSNQTDDTSLVELGPEKILSGHVEIEETLITQVERIEIQYRGVEIVGGTVDDFDDDYEEGLQAYTGIRAFNKVYFDERLVVWQRGTEAAEAPSSDAPPPPAHLRKFDFQIAFPYANYPAQVCSKCSTASSQSFEIAYHVVGWAVGASNAVVGRDARAVGFAPLVTRLAPSAASAAGVPQVTAATAQTAFDERGRECVYTRVTFSQAEYAAGDQVVAGVYIESARTSRTVRRAEAQLRRRVECRMRRTYSSVETAELAMGGGSRPQSSQPSTHSDDSDVLWTRTLDMGPPQPLTLTTSGVGLAAAAAAAGSGCASPGAISVGATLARGVSSSACSVNSEAAVPDLPPVADRRESTLSRAIGPKGSGIIAGLRSCSANMHTHIPRTASLVPGHFLLFSYELFVDVTLSSLTRGNHRVSTRTPLGCTVAAPTPGKHSGAVSAVNGPFSATAACFPQTQLIGGGGVSGTSRFSVGAFQGGSGAGDSAGASALANGQTPSSRFSAMRPALIQRAATQSDIHDNGAVAVPPPDAVDLMRFKYETSVDIVPKIFVPVSPTATETAEPMAEPVKESVAEPVVDPVAEPDKEDVIATEEKSGPSDTNCEDAQIPSPPGDPESSDPASSEPAGASPVDGESASASAAASELDLARAVYAAAEKVLNDKEWERPNSMYLVAAQKSDRKSRRKRVNEQTAAIAAAVAGAKENPRGSLGGASAARPSSSGSGRGERNSRSSSRSRSRRSSTGSSSDSGTSGSSDDDMDVQRAINRLAPQPHQSSSSSSLAGGVRDIISGIDFFGDGADAGPELTGLLSADADKLVFGSAPSPSSAEQSARAGSSATAYSPLASGEADKDRDKGTDTEAEPQSPASPPLAHRINSALRRSMSMPGGGSSMLGARAAAAATATSSASTASMCSPELDAAAVGSTVGVAASEKVLVRRRFPGRAGRSSSSAPEAALGGLSPRSMVSAVSASPLGMHPRGGVFRTLSHRLTSWFKK